jgi:hypothetical protein
VCAHAYTHSCYIELFKLLVKVTLSLCLINQEPQHRHMGKQRYSYTFLDLGSRLNCVVGFTPLPLYLHRKGPQYSLDSRLGGPHCQSGCCGVETNFLPIGNQTPVIQPVDHHYTNWAILAHFQVTEVSYFYWNSLTTFCWNFNMIYGYSHVGDTSIGVQCITFTTMPWHVWWHIWHLMKAWFSFGLL